MTRLTAAEIAQHARTAGWSGDDLTIAVAVALGESGGRTDAIGDVALQTSTWGPSVGLWQIRSLKAERGRGTTRDQDANMNPATNARNAYAIYQAAGRRFKPWTVYNAGIYLMHMPAAAAGVKAAGGTSAPSTGAPAVSGVGVSQASTAWQTALGTGGELVIPVAFETVSSPLEALGNIGSHMGTAVQYLTKLVAWWGDRSNIMRVVKVGAGVVLVAVAARVVIEPYGQKIVKPLIGGATKVAKAVK